MNDSLYIFSMVVRIIYNISVGIMIVMYSAIIVSVFIHTIQLNKKMLNVEQNNKWIRFIILLIMITVIFTVIAEGLPPTHEIIGYYNLGGLE